MTTRRAMASKKRSKAAGVVRPIHPAQSNELGRDRAHGSKRIALADMVMEPQDD
jgi:hypothetical protein